MADKTLVKVYFPIIRITSGDATRAVDDPFGYFSCRSSTMRFLNLEAKAKEALTVNSKETEEFTRVLVLADGTKLSGEGKVAKSTRTQSISSKGSRTVIIKTGKEITRTAPTSGKAKPKAYHTISFRFPSWATIWTIADALGETIPADKIKFDPTASDIFPYFTVVGGRKYPIMEKSAAETNTTAETADNAQEAAALATKAKLKGVKAAGGGA